MFRTLFNDKEKMLELYNAVSEEQMGKEALDDIDNELPQYAKRRLMDSVCNGSPALLALNRL